MSATPLQPSLFDDDPAVAPPSPHPPPASPARRARRPRDAPPPVAPAPVAPEIAALAARLRVRWGDRLRLGTSSWHFPGWAGLVWAEPVPAARLSREGLAAYARHPLLRAVSLDRAFYRPLAADAYRRLGEQVDEGFRFVVKAAARVADATLRDAATGAPLAPNPHFLDPEEALSQCARPAAEGLGARLGALVFQLSPLPGALLADEPALHRRLAALFERVRPALPAAAVLALELRDPVLLTPALGALLRDHGARYALGLHDKMPPIDEQLPLVRAGWPGDLVCRWNLQRGQRYAGARDAWAPFDRLQAPDVPTRTALARVAAATLDAGHRVQITVNNKAEGSAPWSVRLLADAIDAAAQR